METLEIILAIAIIVLFARGLGWLKGIPVKKQTALVLAILIGIGGAYYYNWGGFKSALSQTGLPGVAPVAPAPAGVVFEATGSESDTNLTYDASLQLYVLGYFDNWKAGDMVSPTSLTTAITSVTLSITVYNMSGSAENVASTCTITSSVGTYLDDNAKVRSPVDKDTDLGQWKVAMTPTGGSARNEKNNMSVPAGGSKAMSIVVTTDKEDAIRMDNFQSCDVTFYVQGVTKPFVLRIIKTGVDHTA